MTVGDGPVDFMRDRLIDLELIESTSERGILLNRHTGLERFRCQRDAGARGVIGRLLIRARTPFGRLHDRDSLVRFVKFA